MKRTRASNSEFSAAKARRIMKCGLPLLNRHVQCKSWRRIVTALLLFAAAESSRAQSYSVDWFTIGGGGGAGTGGAYSVRSTIGQPAAGALSGGNFSLIGGFWAIEAIQTPGAPLLTVRRTPTNTVVVSWPSPSTGFSLRQAGNLDLMNWVAPPEIVFDNATNRFIIVNPTAGNRFYRLVKP